MRIELVPLLWLAVACGGPQRRDGTGISGCDDYAAATRAPLARMARAADGFADASRGGPARGAAAGRELAGALRNEAEQLAALRVEGGALRRAHGELLGALGEMSAALDLLSDVLAHRDEARRAEARATLRAASDRWGRAVDRVKAVCPSLR